MRIFTHVNADLDNAFSVGAAWEFIRGAREAELVFVGANYDGSGMEPGDIALDISAGGRGWKGRIDSDGRVHSCFAYIVENFAPKEDRQILNHLVKFIDTQDSQGDALRNLFPDIDSEGIALLSAISISAVFYALKRANGYDDAILVVRMSEILSGILENGRLRSLIPDEFLKDVRFFGERRVVLVVDPPEGVSSGFFFKRGVWAYIYQSGYNIGVRRKNSLRELRMDHPEIRAVVERAGEIDEWHAHPDGYLFCKGARKAPSHTPSKVDPMELAEAVARAIQSIVPTIPVEEVLSGEEDSEVDEEE